MGKADGGGKKFLLGSFIGLVVGVLIAFGVVLYLNKATLPFQEKSGRPDHVEAVLQDPARHAGTRAGSRCGQSGYEPSR
jgi:hypothetical protein